MKTWIALVGLFVMAFPLKEYDHADLGSVCMIIALTLALYMIPYPTSQSIPPPASPVEPEPREVVVRNETHQYNHVIHHNMNYTQVTEATEDSHLLPDGTTVSRRHIRKWS